MTKPLIIDLSMEVKEGMVTFPRVAPTVIKYFENHAEAARGLGTSAYGVDSLTANSMIIISDHCGTHIDSRMHMDPEMPSAAEIPLEYCYGDGVVLDFSHREYGYFIMPEDLQAALHKISYTLKPLDIVLIRSGGAAFNDSPQYVTNHCGMSKEATQWLIDQGIKVMGIDAITFDPPIYAMFEKQKFWESHRLMIGQEYYHVENLTNLELLPPYGFKLALFPVKWRNATAAPIRAVAILQQ